MSEVVRLGIDMSGLILCGPIEVCSMLSLLFLSSDLMIPIFLFLGGFDGGSRWNCPI